MACYASSFRPEGVVLGSAVLQYCTAAQRHCRSPRSCMRVPCDMLAGQTLKEKCLTADLASPFPMGASPPATNTRHGSVTGGEALGRIAEHDENCPSSGDKNKGAAPEVLLLQTASPAHLVARLHCIRCCACAAPPFCMCCFVVLACMSMPCSPVALALRGTRSHRLVRESCSAGACGEYAAL